MAIITFSVNGRLTSDMPRDKTFILCGAGIAWGIKQAAIGLRTRGFTVIVADDAVLDLEDPLSEMAWLQMVAKSTRPLPTAQILRELAPPRRLRQRQSPTVRS